MIVNVGHKKSQCYTCDGWVELLLDFVLVEISHLVLSINQLPDDDGIELIFSCKPAV
jgi:hypothetical protein